ncbi:hypothetical protein HZB89_01645 [archaeon]|nr:hypothetical protein [archaeon]
MSLKKKLHKTGKVMAETESFLKEKTREKLGEAKHKKILFIGLLKLAAIVAIAALAVPLLEEFQANLSFFLLLALVAVLAYMQFSSRK